MLTFTLTCLLTFGNSNQALPCFSQVLRKANHSNETENMSDTIVITFRSQLSIVMETILKSAMIEITRLVEDSFMKEVARGKQEVELLLHRLQFSESKLTEREKRVRCTDCGRATAGGERTSEKAADTLTG